MHSCNATATDVLHGTCIACAMPAHAHGQACSTSPMPGHVHTLPCARASGFGALASERASMSKAPSMLPPLWSRISLRLPLEYAGYCSQQLHIYT